ncbi:MAG TPA: ATP-binding protein [Terriglobales bacterium]|nr:ATP-binding protein [Terriglobales bacterium]
MHPRLRLKTKLVLAISGMVVVLVAGLASVYVSQIVRHDVHDTYQGAGFLANEVLDAAQQALQADLDSARVDTRDPQQVRAAIEEVLQTDPGLNTLLQSIVGYSPTIYDVMITDTRGRVLLHTNPDQIGKVLPEREDFGEVERGSLRRQLEAVFGKPRVYERRLPVKRNGEPFGSIRVGISTVFLKSQLQPKLRSALLFSGVAVLLSLLLAALLSNAALRPLEDISRRLDLASAGQLQAGTPEPARDDEVGAVTTKIDLLGRQIRDAREVFSTLKENLDQIMANLQDGILLFTRDARAVLVSASVERFLGKPRAEMLGAEIWEIFAQHSPLGSLVLDAYSLRQPLVRHEVQAEEGRRLQVSLDFIEERGERIGTLLSLHDAESVRQIEDEIELSQRLSAIGRLTSGVAHEVKNPINAIVLHLEVLRQKLQQTDPDTRRHMEVIGKEIQRLDRVVQTLVDFTRPVELRLAETDLRRLAEEVGVLAAPDAERQGVRIVRELPRQPLRVKVDADLVKQALLNVVLNGVQAMPQGGALTLGATRVGPGLEIYVCDQGPGIPPDLRDKVFNLYFTTKPAGSGIGLAMTYRVMQMHNGSVEFESYPRQGTVFRLRFPALEAEGRAQQEVAARTR